MKKILYGVSGIGNGHANRELPIIEELSKDNKVLILAYDDSYKTLTNKLADNPNVKIVRIAVPFVVGKAGGLDFAATATHAANQKINFLEIDAKALGTVDGEMGTPDLVISDYEPVCAQYAYAKNAPLVTIDQQSKYLCSDLPKSLGGFTFEDEVQRLHMFFPRAAGRIACSFFRTKTKIEGDEVLFMPPPIKEEVVRLKRRPAGTNQILVYVSAAREFIQMPEEVRRELNGCDEATFHLFVNKDDMASYRSLPAQNIILYQHGDPRFVELMGTCDGIAATAGHSLLSEAMYLGIPVYAMPVAPYEQHMNAAAIGDNGFGIDHAGFNSGKLHKFVENLAMYAKNIRDDRRVLIRGIGQELIVDYLRRRFLSKKRLLIFSPPFGGHLNILKEFIRDNRDNYHIHLVVTGWSNIAPDLSGIPVEMVSLLGEEELRETDPALWTFPRVAKLLPGCLKIVDAFKPELIIYDFFSVEGNLAGRIRGVSYWASVPAMMGAFENQKYRNEKFEENHNQKSLARIKEKWGIEIKEEEVEMVSDGFHLPGQINIVWSFKELTPPDFLNNRGNHPYVFVGNLRGDNYEKSNYKNTKPMIYLSFGTVVMNNLWNNQEATRRGLREFFGALAKRWKNKDYQIIFVTQGKKVLDNYPQNWWVYDQVEQVEILSRADLFVTHGGSNSFHEAAMQQTPMLVIPFFGDQLLVADQVECLGFGLKVGGSQNIDTHADKGFLNRELAEKLDNDVGRILTDRTFGSNYFYTNLHSFSLNNLISGGIPYQDGELIVGTGVSVPRSKEQLPTRLGDYERLLRNEEGYLSEEINETMESLRYFVGKARGEQLKLKMLDFFSTTRRVHCLLGEEWDEEIELTKRLWSRYGESIVFYKQVEGSWVPTEMARAEKKIKGPAVEWEKLVVASMSQIKINATIKALDGGGTKVVGSPITQRFDEQLVGVGAITDATVKRLKEIEKREGLPAISMVSGIVQNEFQWNDVAIVMFKDDEGRVAIAKSAGLTFPLNEVQRARARGFENTTVGSVLGEEYADHRVDTNPHTLLTVKKQSREEVLTQAVKQTFLKITSTGP